MNTNEHLEDLVARYVEGTCGPSELASLKLLLAKDAANRKYFLEIVFLAEDLSMLSGSRQRKIGGGLLPVELLLQRQRGVSSESRCWPQPRSFSSPRS
jgi:hypothetical protein